MPKDKKIKYGKMPIYRTKQGDRHPHVVVLRNNNESISVGLSTSNKRGDLKKVYYSNGKTAYMKRNATRQNNTLYENKKENYYLDKDSENRAYRISMNKLLKDIGSKNKKKETLTN